MEKVVWKSFILDDLLDRKTPPSTNVAAKKLNIFEDPFDGSIALITRAETNNGIRGYIDKSTYETAINAITYNDQFSFFLYHNYEFTTIKDHLSIIKAKNSKLQSILDKFDFVNGYLVKILNRIYSKEIFNFNFTGADYRFDREIVLLPCLFVKKDDEYIWEEDGKYYTLAVDYIKKLMDKAKDLKEQKTIRYYEKEKAKYEKEKAKYEKAYLEEKKNVVWKSFALGDIFERSTRNALGMNQKDLNVFPEKESENNVALISASRSGSGRVGYINLGDDEKNKISNNKLTFDDQWGFVYFQTEDFIITGGHNSVLEFNNKKWENIFNQELYCYLYFAKIINKITIKSNIFGYGYKINNKLDREIVLLPLMKTKEEKQIYNEDINNYTIAINYISYIYLQGRCNYYQKLIDEYTYKY